jgi:phthiocerol/phenolphthiocerol synthesis type-I polyketide synthase D
VRFSQAVAAALEKHGNHTFVEVSPHPLLTHAISETLTSASSSDHFIVTPAMKRGEDETLSVHMQLATLGVTGPKDERRRPTDIPPSPWLHAKYWQEQKPAGQRLPDVHPLLGVHVEMPSGREHVWQADIGTETMPWLADHQVQGQAVMSAAGFAEMALAAGQQALKLPVDAVQVSALEIEQPLVLDRQTRVTTQLAYEGDGNHIEIHANSADGAWSRYAVASFDVTHADALAGQPDVASGTEIELPDEIADHPEYCIHPALLDAALHQLAAAIPASTETSYLPVSAATIRVFGPIGRRARCHTDLVEQEDGGYHGRIVLRDDTGALTAELTGIELRPVDPRTVPLLLQQKTFDTDWVASSIPEIDSAPAGSWLLLAEAGSETAGEPTPLHAEFATRLSSPTRRVISAELSDETGVLNAVARTATDPDLPPAGVIVFLGQPSFDGADFDGALRRARELIWAISTAAHAIVDGWQGKPPRLWLVTRNGISVRDDEPGDPAIGALKGLIRNWRFPGEAARVLAGEPDLGATLVDLGGSDDLQKLLTSLMSELQSPAADDVIAWRESSRYVERLSRAGLDGRHRDAVVSADGSYIVTGGLGGLGTVVTRWLVERGAGRLVLNGRSEPSDDQRKALADMANGTEIVYVSGDIASPEVADRLVAAAEETGRPLRGVVHGAGVTGDGLVTALTREGMTRVWAPKVHGALRLHAATATRQLDWWVGFSSMATLLGLPGQLAYTTANAWLDALVAWRRASGLPATAINWGQWSDVGMSRALTYSVLDPITPDEGIEALQALAGGALGRVGVGRLRLDRAVAATPEFRELGYFEKLVSEFDRTSDTSSADDRSTVDNSDQSAMSVPDWSQLSAEDRLSELETRLRTILARELRMSASAVKVDQPFPELGLDSMMAMAVLRAAQKLVGMDLSANMLFNHPTISSLAAYLTDLLAPREVPQEDTADASLDSAGSVLDELFDHVESASAGSERGIYR